MEAFASAQTKSLVSKDPQVRLGAHSALRAKRLVDAAWSRATIDCIIVDLLFGRSLSICSIQIKPVSVPQFPITPQILFVLRAF